MSSYALLSLPALDVDSDGDPDSSDSPERDYVLLNGQPVEVAGSEGYLVGQNDTWRMNHFRVPISALRFGRSTGIANSPIPGLNSTEIKIDGLSNGADRWCTTVPWASLTFAALAPVIMVHGNSSDREFWEDFNFTTPFQTMRLQFDNSIDMRINDSVVAHSNLLGAQIPQIAHSLGADHAHLVAHSKGGLESRDFLVRTIPKDFGVYSLTTTGDAAPRLGLR
jgi:triacylglycerol lipase